MDNAGAAAEVVDNDVEDPLASRDEERQGHVVVHDGVLLEKVDWAIAKGRD